MTGSMETFMPFRHAENLSLEWLFEGIGAPYVIRECGSDRRAWEWIEHLFAGEPADWVAYVLTDHRANAVLLYQPACYRIGERLWNYRRIEVMVGPIGPQSLTLLDESEVQSRRVAVLTTDDMLKLRRGQIGTYALLGPPSMDEANVWIISGLLAGAEDKHQFRVAEIAEPVAEIAGHTIDRDLETIIGYYEAMAPKDRTHLVRITEVLAS